MYPALLHSHSGLRWIVLILLLATIAGSFGGKQVSPSLRKLSLFTLIATHLQAVLGLTLFMYSPKVNMTSEMMGNATWRFFTMEHTVMMLIAIILITLGNRGAKQGNGKKLFWYFLIGLIIILAAIPWPFRTQLGAGWF
jgi:hypothetical protein